MEQTTLGKTSVGIETGKKLVPLESVTTKIICKIFISGKFEQPTSKKLFSNQYNIYDEGTWRIIYSLPARVTIDIKIRMFQYKILNNILFLNQRLYYMKKIDSPLCSLCKREIETVSHLFLKCEQSENLWLSTQKWCNSTLKLPHLSEKVIHLGWLSEQPKWILVNHIILLYKYFIYLKRDDTMRVNFHAISQENEKIKTLSKASEVDKQLFWQMLKGSRVQRKTTCFMENDKLINTSSGILDMWANNFSALGQPTIDPCFNEEFRQHIELSVKQTLDDCLHTLTCSEDLFTYDIVKEVCLGLINGVAGVLTMTTYEHIKFRRA